MSRSIVLIFGADRGGLDALIQSGTFVEMWALDGKAYIHDDELPDGRCVAFTVTAVFEDEE